MCFKNWEQITEMDIILELPPALPWEVLLFSLCPLPLLLTTANYYFRVLLLGIL